MTLDVQLLKRAQSEAARMAEAEREALLARADYHTMVRRLHLGGASLREIAEALGLSHQRVQQIVRGAGGSWWQRVWRSRNVRRDAVCTFCERPPAEVAKLIAGPNVYICDACVAAAERTLEDAGSHPFKRSKNPAARCVFCGRLRSPKRRFVSAPPGLVCSDCLAVCRQILNDRAA
jgi:hypothetical protein